MNKTDVFLLSILTLSFAFLQAANATNGVNLIGVGPISTSMGGVGIAEPQDAVSALYSNPSALTCNGTCPDGQLDLATTLITSSLNAKITYNGNPYSANSSSSVATIPSVGTIFPVNEKLRVGLAMEGIAGAAVDYRNTAIDQPAYFDLSGGSMTYGAVLPLNNAGYSSYSVLQFSSAVSYAIKNNFSLGGALKINNGNLDLGSGTSSGYGFGGQLGLSYKPSDILTLGLMYTSTISTNYKNVRDFDGDRKLDDFKFDTPQVVGIGVAVKPLQEILVESDLKWINCSSAEGYKDLDVADQWVFNVGVQHHIFPSFAVRAGYNYAKSPLHVHNNFNGTGAATTNLQGKLVPTYYYENMRTIGFPIIAEQHVSLGAGYDVSKKLTLNAGYIHVFSNSITENGTYIDGKATSLTTNLAIDSFDFDVSWKY